MRLPIEERACRETDLGGGDYYLRNSGLPPSLDEPLPFVFNRALFYNSTVFKL